MAYKHLREQIDLLREHLEQERPSAEFIERHALEIIQLAKELPAPERAWAKAHAFPVSEHAA